MVSLSMAPTDSPLPRRIVHKSKGKSYTNIGICTYFAMLFRMNELAPKKRKMTDDQIAAEIEKEYPNRPSAQCFRGPNKKRTINEYRLRYNSGRFTHGTPPTIYSYRYDSMGNRVDGRTGKYPLPAIQVLGLQSSHRYHRGLNETR